MNQLSYYMDRIENGLTTLEPNLSLRKQFQAEYDAAFDQGDDDKALIRRLRVINERINQAIDASNMDGMR